MILNLVCETVLLFYTDMKNNTDGYDCWSLVLAFSWDEQTKNTNGNQTLFPIFCIIIFCAVFLGVVSQNIHRRYT